MTSAGRLSISAALWDRLLFTGTECNGEKKSPVGTGLFYRTLISYRTKPKIQPAKTRQRQSMTYGTWLTPGIA
jgi:hypothetical protein